MSLLSGPEDSDVSVTPTPQIIYNPGTAQPVDTHPTKNFGPMSIFQHPEF